MAEPRELVFLKRAFRDRVPIGAVRLRCRNWGVAPDRAVEIAEEAAAEAYYRVLGRPYETEEHFRRSLTEIAMNFTVDMLRRDGRTRSGLSLDEMTAPGRLGEQDAAELAEGMAKLTEMEQTILRLTYWENRTLDEIADQVLPPGEGTATSRRIRIHRARKLALRRLHGYFE